MDKIEKIKSFIRMNGNPFYFDEPVFNRITGIVISYDTVLILTHEHYHDINDVYDNTINELINEIDRYEAKKNSYRRRPVN